MKKEKNHKFKQGDKFVIEIAECHTHWHDNGYPMSLYRVKGFGTLIFDDGGLSKLEKMEKDTKEEIVKDFAKFLIDKNIDNTSDLVDLVVEYLR